MQIMGVAWRGNVEPVRHSPDPAIQWQLPAHLQRYSVSGQPDHPNWVEFRELLATIRPFTLLSEARLFSLYTLAKQVCFEDLPGHFVECGSYKGGCAAMLAVIIQRYSARPRFVYAFDTFDGMPEPTEFDRHNTIPANQTGFGAGTLKAPIQENLAQICQILGVSDLVLPIQGLFADTLSVQRGSIDDIALLHADGDWYESTLDIFNNLYDQVVQGGVIQIDDYGHWEGCRQAVHEFEQSRGEHFNLRRIDYTGVWFPKRSESPLDLKMPDNLLQSLPLKDQAEEWVLSEINLILFPDWESPQELIIATLEAVLRGLIRRPDYAQITLLIDGSNVPLQSNLQPDQILMGTVMNLFLEQTDAEVLVFSEEPKVFYLGQPSSVTWRSLLPHLHGCIRLPQENQAAIQSSGADSLPALSLEALAEFTLIS
jgi:hypothetical protein